MSDINVQLKDGVAVPMPASTTVGEALKKLDRDLAKQALAAKVRGFEVDLAAQLDAIPRADAEPSPDSAVQIDPVMPQTRDGLEVLRQIKSDAALKSIPVVIFTSSRERADLARTYLLGANAYVVKPLGFQEFVSALKDVKKFWLIINEPPPADFITASSPPNGQSQPQPAPTA